MRLQFKLLLHLFLLLGGSRTVILNKTNKYLKKICILLTANPFFWSDSVTYKLATDTDHGLELYLMLTVGFTLKQKLKILVSTLIFSLFTDQTPWTQWASCFHDNLCTLNLCSKVNIHPISCPVRRPITSVVSRQRWPVRKQTYKAEISQPAEQHWWSRWCLTVKHCTTVFVVLLNIWFLLGDAVLLFIVSTGETKHKSLRDHLVL